MLQFWLTLRLLWRGRFFNWTTLLTLAGVVVGVATLVITMSVISGVETLLQKAVIDVTGHIMLMKPGGETDPMKTLAPRVKKVVPSLVAMTPFVHLEAVVARKGKITGIIIQGVDTATVESVLNLRSRVIEGEFSLNPVNAVEGALIGKEFAKKMSLKIGDVFQIVMPKPSKVDSTSFAPTKATFHVNGILDLGKFEFNERLIIVSDLAAQNLAGIGNVYSGLRLKLSSDKATQDAGYQITGELGPPYWIRDWFESNYNFFSAIAIEKSVIFIVLLFMVLVASFNISSTLFVNVLKKFRDVSILKTLGATRFQLVRLFVFQGMVLGVMGSIFGVLVGMGLAELISHSNVVEIPAEVYKFDHLPVEFRILDIAAILVVTMLICFFSTLIPAIRGSRLNPVEGLRYE